MTYLFMKKQNYKLPFYPLLFFIHTSKLGAGIFSFALLLYFVSQNQNLWKGSFILSMYYIAKLVLSPVAGAIVDRYRSYKNILLANELFGMVLYACLFFVNIDLPIGFFLLNCILVIEIFLNRLNSATF